MSLIAASCVLAAALAQGPVELRMKYTPGKEYTFRQTQKQTTQTPGGPMTQETKTTYLMMIDEVDGEGNATIVTKYKSLAVKASGLQAYEYDSEKDGAAPANPAVQAQAKLVGQAITMRMSPRGEVLQVKGFQEILDKMVEDQPPATKAQMKQMLGQMFSDDTAKSMWQQMSPMLPKGKVSPGDSWKNDFAVPLPMIGKMTFDVTSTLDGLKGGKATIEQNIKITMGDADPGSPLAGMVKIEDAKGRTTSILDLERGIFVLTETEMQMVMNAAGQDMTTTSSTKTELVE